MRPNYIYVVLAGGDHIYVHLCTYVFLEQIDVLLAYVLKSFKALS